MKVFAMVVILLTFASCASPDAPRASDVDRTVQIVMRDNHFEPDEVDVERGETVEFTFVNRGSVRHDAFIGDADAQEEHEEQARMSDDGGHAGGHDEDSDDAVLVSPGKRGTIVHTFTGSGDLLIGCHEPGHYEDGMRISVSVT